MTTTPHNGERGGGVGVEMALLWIAMLALIAAATQVALVFYAGQLALTAAQDGVHAATTQNTATQNPTSQNTARDAAQSFLARSAGTVLTPTEVTVTLEQGGGVLRVQVHGQALSLIPGMRLPVDKTAVAALERVTP